MPPHQIGHASTGHRLLAASPALGAVQRLARFAVGGLLASSSHHNDLAKRSLEAPEAKEPDDPALWIYLGVAAALVLLGGAFAGLTIALMGQDEIYLQVIRTSGEGPERKHAARVLHLLDKGKHWVLVTLLLSNVITNETLPIVLDRSLGGGWPAVLGSTVLIVIFGEIIPQSICVRYGLQIGAWMSAPVLALMYVMSPVAWPTAKLLDRALGEEHGTTYKKAGLKTLVTLHRTLGEPTEQLNSDEVTIISAVLDLKEKPVGAIMTPMQDVFTMSADTVLDENMMDVILSAGYSRIPIHHPDNIFNFVGMLLVKMLITYDPEDAKRVRDFALATLPETRADTSCLDIVNFFQEGKSHMVLVSEFPGENYGALGVVTLEDVIEELIGEEIIDESDVFIDVHKAIRRLAPSPRTRVPRGEIVTEPNENAAAANQSSEGQLIAVDGLQPSQPALRRQASLVERRRTSLSDLSHSPKTTFLIRRNSGMGSHGEQTIVSRRADAPEVFEHLKHLGPSNLASKPRSTRYTNVKIKPGTGEGRAMGTRSRENSMPTASRTVSLSNPANLTVPGGGSAASASLQSSQGLYRTETPQDVLIHSSGGREASDGVLALQQGYGTMGGSSGAPRPATSGGTVSTTTHPATITEESYLQPTSSRRSDSTSKAVQTHLTPAASPGPTADDNSRNLSREGSYQGQQQPEGQLQAQHDKHPYSYTSQTSAHQRHHERQPSGRSTTQSSHSSDTVDSLRGPGENRAPRRHHHHGTARSGSITENVIESSEGIKKVVLETTSSSEEPQTAGQMGEEEDDQTGDDSKGGSESKGAGWAGRRKKRKERKKKEKREKKERERERKKGEDDDRGDGAGEPLLGGGS